MPGGAILSRVVSERVSEQVTVEPRVVQTENKPCRAKALRKGAPELEAI